MRSIVLLAAIAMSTLGMTAMPSSVASAAGTGRLIRVPEDVATPREAIALAEPGDVILLAAGTYDGGLVVPEAKHDLTIRGVDRNTVIFDGRGFNLNAIEVEADRVTLENLSAHDVDGNAFYWERVEGFTGRYLTVWNVNLYGIYATESRDGVFEHSLVSGAADAAFYVGECQPCDTTVRGVEGRLSAIGYSGTNTGEGLQLLDSTWVQNGTGILPNSFEGQAADAPERASLIEGNVVRDSGRVPVPAHTPLAGFIGLGIGIAGGNENVIRGNTISGSARYGIALFPSLQQSGTAYAPAKNQIQGNTVSGSGDADLGVAAGPGEGNCFAGNTFSTSLPAELERTAPCGGAGPAGAIDDPTVAGALAIPVPEALEQLAAQGPRPDYRSMPQPEAQPSSPDGPPAGLRPFRDTGGSPLLAVLGVVFLVALGVGLMFRGRVARRPPR